MSKIPILTVSEISYFIKDALEAAMPIVQVVGEVSNCIHHSSGHIYFSLKDSESLIKVVCFKSSALAQKVKMENGEKVIVTGMLTAYVKSSNYQIIAEKIEKTGVGELHKLFEALKQKLAKEGLFEEKYKKPLPAFPASIGLITAEKGAVLQDILTTAKTRMPCKFILYKSIMQGVKTAQSVIEGINYFNKNKNVDVIIIARGGGSFEDLFEFNNEELARCAFSSNIPIISAIGHETDFTILDFIASKRAATPTASIIIALKSKTEFAETIQNNFEAIKYFAKFLINKKEVELKKAFLQIKDAKYIIEKKQISVQSAFKEIKNFSFIYFLKLESYIAKLSLEINSYNPTDIMEKGFAILCQNEKRISSVKDLKEKEAITIYLKDGKKDVYIANPKTVGM